MFSATFMPVHTLFYNATLKKSDVAKSLKEVHKKVTIIS